MIKKAARDHRASLKAKSEKVIQARKKRFAALDVGSPRSTNSEGCRSIDASHSLLDENEMRGDPSSLFKFNYLHIKFNVFFIIFF